MSKHIACPHCGQRMAYMRAGARLPPLKAKIYDAIERAGKDGIHWRTLVEEYDLEVGYDCIRAHVWQINEILERFGAKVRIASPRRGLEHDLRGYRLVERKIALVKEKRL